MKQHLLTLLPGLDRAKFQLEVACPPDPELLADLHRLAVPVHAVAIADRIHPPADFAATAELVRLIRNRGYQIVHTHGAKAGLVGRVAARLCRVPVIVATVHNSVYYGDRTRAQHRLLAVAHHLLGRGTDLLITVSEALRAEVIYKEGIEAEKVRVIRNGIDLDRFLGGRPLDRKELGLPEGSPIIGTVARLAPQKGVSYLLEAAARLKPRIPDLRVLVVGDGPLRGELERLAAALGL
jgi:glycosyltransferase involved in cell wall biosynthesis